MNIYKIYTCQLVPSVLCALPAAAVATEGTLSLPAL